MGLQFLIFFCVTVCAIVRSNSSLVSIHGGITSDFVREANYSADMPLDSDVFRVPPGFNAPQQVKKSLLFLQFFNFLMILHFMYMR